MRRSNWTRLILPSYFLIISAARCSDPIPELPAFLRYDFLEALERTGCVGRPIGIELRYDDFRTVTRDVTLAAPVADAAAIRRAAGACLTRVPLERRLRLLGVRVGGLQHVHDDVSTPPGDSSGSDDD